MFFQMSSLQHRASIFEQYIAIFGCECWQTISQSWPNTPCQTCICLQKKNTCESSGQLKFVQSAGATSKEEMPEAQIASDSAIYLHHFIT
jgi:hypothetical protein